MQKIFRPAHNGFGPATQTRINIMSPNPQLEKPGAARRPPSWLSALETIVLALPVLIAYSNHFHNSFHFDDSHTIVDNGAIRDLRNVPQFFADARLFSVEPSNQSYRPLVSVALAFDYAMAGKLDPFWFQLTDFVFFVVTVMLLKAVTQSLLDAQRPGAWNRCIAIGVAGLYAVHPANADTVNYVIAQSDILSTLAIMASFVCADSLSVWVSGISALPAAIGVLAKPPAAMFAPLFALRKLLYPGTEGMRSRRMWAQLAAAFVLCGAAALFVSHMTPKTWQSGGNDPVGYLLTQPYVALLYFKMFFWPAGLSADYDLGPLSDLHDARLWMGFGFAAILFGGAVYCCVQPRLRVIGFGLGWYIIGLLPTSLMPLSEVMNDHRVFLPNAGLVIALAGLLQLATIRGRSWSRAMWIAGGVATVAVLTMAVVGTYIRNKTWKDEETLWWDVSIKSPLNGRGLMNYGTTQMAKARYTVALEYFHRAAAVYPYYSFIYINTAIAEAATGHDADAERDFSRVERMAPSSPDSYTFYSRYLVDHGRAGEAIPKLQKALALSPGNLTAQDLLKRAQGKPGSEAYTPEQYLDLSLRRYQEKDYEGSLAAAQKAVGMRADYAEAWNNIGAALNSEGKFSEARSALLEAVKFKPDWPLARNNLNYALKMMPKESPQDAP